MTRIKKNRLALVIIVIIITGIVLGYLAVDRINTENGVNPINNRGIR